MQIISKIHKRTHDLLAHLSLKAHWWAYSIGMLRLPAVVVSPSTHHFQRSSSQKPLGQSKPNFMWSLHGSGEWKFVWGIWVIWPRWPPRPYGKTLQKSSSPEPKGQWPWALVCIIGPIKVCSNDDLGLTLTCFIARSNWSLMLLYEKICWKVI